MSAPDSSVVPGAAASPPAPGDAAFPVGDFSAAILDQMLNGVACCRMIFEDGRASDFVYLYTNPAFHHLTGLGPVCGKRVSEVIPGIRESDSKLIEIYGRVAAGAPPEKFEIFIESLQQWFSVQVSSPRPEYFVAAFDVITESKRAEALSRTRLRLTELAQAGTQDELLQTALDGAEEATGSQIGFFHFVDPDQETLTLQVWSTNTLAHMCKAEGKGLHYSISEAGVWVDAFHTRAPVIHNDYAGLAHKKGMPEGHAPVTRELVVPIIRAGKVTEIMGVGNKASHYAQEDVDAVVMVAAMVQDILDRRRAEAALRESEGRLSAVFQASPIGISVTRVADGKILEVNSAALQMYGYARESVIGRTVAELGVYVNPGQRDEMVQGLRAQGGVDRFPIDFRRSSGEAGLMEVSARVIELQGEECLVGMMVDATERKRLEELHLQAQKLEALGTLAGGVAHDFNNIIASIVGNAELARRDVGPGHPALVSLDEIGVASRRAKDLVQQILAFGRRHLVERKVIALAPVVQEAARLLQVTLPAGVSLEVECDQGAPNVLADATQIGQVVLNLGNNAWQSIQTQARPGTIVVRLHSHEQLAYPVQAEAALVVLGELRPGRYACISVEDNGSGMDEATLPHMFEPFFTTKPVGKGTGLGLAVVHGIAQEHNAAIVVRSVPGEGSVFRVYFPEAQAAGPVHRAFVHAAASEHGQGKHILYVDDDEAIVFLMTRLLERQGYRVSGYTEPRRALAVVRAEPGQFDLAVTDYNMPDMSGLAVARALKEIKPDLPIAMASGYITDELRLQAPAAGVSELIYKPNTVEDLCEAVARLARSAVTKPAEAL